MKFLVNHVEALIFCAPQPIALEEIVTCLKEMFEADIPAEDVALCVLELKVRYSADQFAFTLIESGGGYQYLTKPAYQASIAILLKQQSKKRLSKSALETLSIIAYKQPVTKTEMEQIRGVSCDYTVQRLLEKELVEIKGKSESVGRPILYGTSPKFMDYFGINALNELPMPKDFAMNENEIGSKEE
jgi:segregation and condensation protein B